MGQVALFCLGDESFAVTGDAVAHIIMMPQLFPLPLACPEIFGIFVRDGQPVYVLDLLKIYDLPFELTPELAEHTLICRSEAGLVGLPATRLERIVSVEAGDLEETNLDDFAWMRYHFTMDDRKYQLVDVDTLVATLLR